MKTAKEMRKIGEKKKAHLEKCAIEWAADAEQRRLKRIPIEIQRWEEAIERMADKNQLTSGWLHEEPYPEVIQALKDAKYGVDVKEEQRANHTSSGCVVDGTHPEWKMFIKW